MPHLIFAPYSSLLWRAGKAASVLFEIAKTDAIQAVLEPGTEPVLASTSGVGWGGNGGLSSVEWSKLTDAEQSEWVRSNCFDCQHASGTCRMGKDSDPATVVSSEVPDAVVLHLLGAVTYVVGWRSSYISYDSIGGATEHSCLF